MQVSHLMKVQGIVDEASRLEKCQPFAYNISNAMLYPRLNRRMGFSNIAICFHNSGLRTR